MSLSSAKIILYGGWLLWAVLFFFILFNFIQFIFIFLFFHGALRTLTILLFLSIISQIFLFLLFTDSGNTLSEEVKRVLSNNNALPGHGAHDEAECSDTQSMECPFPHHLRGVAAEHAAFPQEDDKKLLMELIRGRKASPSHMDAQRVQVRKVRTKKYADSDSSSGSERSSPLLSSRNESMFTHTDSLRSSTISSEGRITMVTDTISDLDYPLSESCQPSPRSMRALSPDNRSPSLSHREMNGGRSRSPSPSTRSQGQSRLFHSVCFKLFNAS